MATCLNCGKSFEPRKGSVGKYCSMLCANRHMRGNKDKMGKFEPISGLGPRLSLIKMSGPGTWERDNIKDIIPGGD